MTYAPMNQKIIKELVSNSTLERHGLELKTEVLNIFWCWLLRICLL